MCRRFDAWCWVLLAGSALLLGGCGSTHPGLAKFGAAATGLADSYRPILASPSRLCSENLGLKLLVTEVAFDIRALEKEAGIGACNKLADQQALRMVVADAIGAYGEQLSLLAGADPAALQADVEGVATAVKGIKDQQGDPTFDETKVDALTTVTTALVEWVRGREARRTAKELMDRSQQPLESLVQEMTTWTQGTVIPRLDESILTREGVLSALVRQSRSSDAVPTLQTYPYRLAQSAVLKEIGALQQEKKAATAFVPAAEAFVESHRQLSASFDAGGKEAGFTALRGFIEKLRALRKASQAR